MLRPLGRCLAFIKCLPGDWLAYGNLESLVPVLEHFITQIEHRDIEFYTKHPVYIRKPVEEL